MKPEELTDERLLRLIKLGAATSDLHIEALEHNETIAASTFEGLLWFYITRKDVVYSVGMQVPTKERAAQARDVLEEHGLDAMLENLWAPYADKLPAEVDVSERGLTPEHWDDLFYIVSHELVYFMWGSHHRNVPVKWWPILICNDLWMLACSDFSELPFDQLKVLRKAHELFGGDGSNAWACVFNDRVPVERHTKRDNFQRAQLWLRRVKEYGLDVMIKRGTSDGQSERQTS